MTATMRAEGTFNVSVFAPQNLPDLPSIMTPPTLAARLDETPLFETHHRRDSVGGASLSMRCRLDL